jgi:aspartate/tyrosine/aromatic aminotransferase
LKDPDTDNDKEAEAPSEPYINLAVPGFREDNGNIFIPPTVRYIEKKMRDENILAKEPLSIQGDPKFLAEATTFAYGADAPAIKKDLVSSLSSERCTLWISPCRRWC